MPWALRGGTSILSWWALMGAMVAARQSSAHEASSSSIDIKCEETVLGDALPTLGARSLIQREPSVHTSRHRSSAQEEQDGNSRDWPPKPPKVVFIKTHSTGSSTLTNILHRICDTHNRVCAGPVPDTETGATVQRPQLAEFVDRNAGKVDIWPNHVIFEDDLFDRLMPGAVKVSLFREPQSRMVSAYAHVDPFKAFMAVDAMQKDSSATPECGDAGYLMAAQVPLEKFAKLDFVMLTEEYDLSLVMLGRQLGWALEDMLYRRLNDHRTVDSMTQMAMDNLKRWMQNPLTDTARRFLEACAGSEEEALYSMAKEKFAAQWEYLTSDEQTEVKQHVAMLQAGVSDLESCCATTHHDPFCHSLKESNIDWNERTTRNEEPRQVSDAWCRKSAIDAMWKA